MNALEHIRKNVLKLTQSGLAEVAGVSQGTVSRWETGELEPTREQMGRIRAYAHEQRIKWNDAWFFSPPGAERPFEGRGAAA